MGRQHMAPEQLSIVGTLFLRLPSYPTFVNSWLNVNVFCVPPRLMAGSGTEGGVIAVPTSGDTTLNSTLSPSLVRLFRGN